MFDRPALLSAGAFNQTTLVQESRIRMRLRYAAPSVPRVRSYSNLAEISAGITWQRGE